eukprot:TRINITY_DN2368_c0_g1_i11.p1 TRINITY_DN2368_c0_g1~~TRINITY_DN2368_c0_g1_i11.p1  ORF type:complete len:129 (+),score=15.66 TRINITY_DN2368_c0_g1_i11:244-630(+)
MGKPAKKRAAETIAAADQPPNVRPRTHPESEPDITPAAPVAPPNPAAASASEPQPRNNPAPASVPPVMVGVVPTREADQAMAQYMAQAAQLERPGAAPDQNQEAAPEAHHQLSEATGPTGNEKLLTRA